MIVTWAELRSDYGTLSWLDVNDLGVLDHLAHLSLSSSIQHLGALVNSVFNWNRYVLTHVTSVNGLGDLHCGWLWWRQRQPRHFPTFAHINDLGLLLHSLHQLGPVLYPWHLWIEMTPPRL